MKRAHLDPESWRIVREIFDDALEADPSERSDLIAARCAGDPALRAEVMSLLEADTKLEHESADTNSASFLESSFGSLAQILSSSAKAAEPVLPEPPFRWGPLEVRAPIGAGSFGRVYSAHDATLQRDVALKLRAVDALGNTSDGELHLEEARRLARVRHPNVLVVHGAEIHDGFAGIWTDLVRGETLDLLLKRNGPFSREALARVGIDLCRALEAVHAAGIVHGDIKPSNVMRDEDGRVLLMDFGSGREESSATGEPERPSMSGVESRTESRPGLRQGTPVAMAPELWEGAAPSISSDLYALGVLLYRVASGQYPFTGSGVRGIEAAVREQDCIPLDELRPDLPSAFVRVVHRMLAPNPPDRPASAVELRWLIAASLGSEEMEIDPDESRAPHLPHFSTRFVGRAAELRQLRSLLTEPGIVTVAGAGGCGKTRLAAQVTAELNRSLPGGAIWIDLAPIDDPSGVANAAAHAAGLADRTEEPQDALARWIANRSMLLVFDNAEHLRAEIARLCAHLVSVCEGLKVLVTSRQRLSIPGERTFRLTPMTTPSERASSDGLSLLESDAVRLFLDRARRAGDELRMTPSNANEIARVVRRVEGIPLAVELAAARVPTLGLAVLADRLEESFRLLSARNRAGSKRHSTLAASIEWSFDLLEAKEARLLARLAVFSGGWSLAGAEAVCHDESSEAREELRSNHSPSTNTDARSKGLPSESIAGSPIELEQTVDLLSSLVERSLVSVDSLSEEPRYRLLEMVRSFAMERLDASGEGERIRDRHLAWVEEEAQVHGRGIHGPEMHRHMAWLDREHGNVRAALQRRVSLVRSGKTASVDRLVPLCADLRPYWSQSGRLREGLEAFGIAVAELPPEHPHRGLALACYASFQRAIGLTHLAIQSASEAVATERKLGSTADRLPTALSILAMLHADLGSHEQARAHFIEVLVLREGNPNPVHSIATLCNLGVLEAAAGDLEAAQVWYEDALARARRHQDQSSIGHILGNLALTLIERGRLEEARPIAEESLRSVRRTATVSGLWTGARPMALLQIADGQWREATLLMREVLDAIGSDPGFDGRVGILDTIADLLVARGKKEEAAEILGSIDADQERSSLKVQVGFRARWERRQTDLRRSLGPERFDSAWVRGRLRAIPETLQTARQLLHYEETDA